MPPTPWDGRPFAKGKQPFLLCSHVQEPLMLLKIMIRSLRSTYVQMTSIHDHIMENNSYEL